MTSVTTMEAKTKRAEPKEPIYPSQCYGFASSTPTSAFSIRVSAFKVSTKSAALRRTPKWVPFVHVRMRHSVNRTTDVFFR